MFKSIVGIKRGVSYLLHEKIQGVNAIGKNVQLSHSSEVIGSRLTGEVKIGNFAKIYKAELHGKIAVGNNTSLWGPNLEIICRINPITIGNFCSIANNVSIMEHNHNYKNITSYYIWKNLFNDHFNRDITSKGPIIIGHDVWIGSHCVVLSGVSVGNGAVIGANSVVTKDIPPFAIVAGSPAAILGYRFNEDIIEELSRIKWWNWSHERIRRNGQLFEGELNMEKIFLIQD